MKIGGAGLGTQTGVLMSTEYLSRGPKGGARSKNPKKGGERGG